MEVRCIRCFKPFEFSGRGRPQKYCSAACKQAAYRERNGLTGFPAEMRFRNQWVRRRGKVPLQVSGGNASSTNPGTWSSFDEVSASRVGDGLGIMLGNGLGCLDLDHCIDAGGVVAPWALAVIAKTENIVFIEVSLSGDGLHVFRLCPEASGRRFPQVGGGAIEVYSRARFIACTGNVWRGWHRGS